MRINEIANAQEQVALLKLIMDKTWEALATQARQQAEQKAAQPISKAKPKAVKPAPKPPMAPAPKKLPIPKVQPSTQQKQVAPQMSRVGIQRAVTAKMPVQQNYTAPISKPLQPQNRSNDSKDGFSNERDAKEKNELDSKDRHSKNGLSF